MDAITLQADGWLLEQLDEALEVHHAVRKATGLITDTAARMALALAGGGQVFFFGNGGSAADAQHWAAELSGRFYFDRPSLPAQALSVNTSQVTAIGNDYGFEEIFARPLSGAARAGDMAVGISTSGRSPNVLRAFEVARERGVATVGFCGAEGGRMRDLCDVLISIPSPNVARVQEGHELVAHLVFSLVERHLFSPESR